MALLNNLIAVREKMYFDSIFPYYTVIRKIFVVKKFSFHPKRRKFLTRILFTDSIIRSEYMAHT